MTDTEPDNPKTDKKAGPSNVDKDMDEFINKVSDLINLKRAASTKMLPADKLEMMGEFIDEYKNTKDETMSTLKNMTSQLNEEGKKEFLNYINSDQILRNIGMVENLVGLQQKQASESNASKDKNERYGIG